MTLLDFQMKMFGWFFRWKTMRDTINKTKLRTREEVVIKKKEFETKLLTAEKQSVDEKLKYLHYLDVIRWILKEI